MDPNQQQAGPSVQSAPTKKSKRSLLQEIAEELRSSRSELRAENDWTFRFLSDTVFYQEQQNQSNQEKLLQTMNNMQQAISALAQSENDALEFEKDALHDMKLSLQMISSSIPAMLAEIKKQNEEMGRMCTAILSINTILERQEQMQKTLPEKSEN